MSDSARKRTSPNRAARSVVGDGRDLDAVASLVWAGFLSTSQIQRLHFPSRRRAQRRLRMLLDHGLVRAHLQGGALERENVYVPSALGIDRLIERGDFDGSRPVPPRLPASQKLAHGLANRDVFVEAVLLERAVPGREVDVQFDSDLTRDPRFAPHRIVPDVILSLRVPGHAHEFAVEVDRGTETTTTLRVKLEGWRRVLVERQKLALAVVVPGAARAATIARLASEVGVLLRVVVVRDLARWLDTEWPRPPAAAPDRTERLPAPLIGGLFRATSR